MYYPYTDVQPPVVLLCLIVFLLQSCPKMPALQVVGEIVGASDVRIKDAGSSRHWFDRLALHPSSELSYFCRWRLSYRQPQRSKTSPFHESWRLLQGDAQGQTQTHVANQITPITEQITRASDQTDHTNDLVELDTLWSHPFDLHLAISSATDALSCRPHLEFEVWSLDEFQLEQLFGTASLALPFACGEYFLDLPIIQPTPPSVLDHLARVLRIPSGNEDRKAYVDESVGALVGTLYMRFAVLHSGFQHRGVFTRRN